jgi:hypothetical protein
LEYGGSRAGHGEMGSRSFFLDETIKNIVIIAVFVVAVALVERLLKATGAKKAAPVPVSNEQPDRKE